MRSKVCSGVIEDIWVEKVVTRFAGRDDRLGRKRNKEWVKWKREGLVS